MYIKGLKIPPSGQYVFVLTSSGMVENVNGLVVGEAVEIKAPHGRLIDVESLGYPDVFEMDWGWSEEKVETAPTVIEAEK